MLDKQFLTAFGRVIAHQRTLKNLTQTELGLGAGVKVSYISSIERGRSNLSLIAILKLSKALDLQPFDLVSLLDVVVR